MGLACNPTSSVRYRRRASTKSTHRTHSLFITRHGSVTTHDGWIQCTVEKETCDRWWWRLRKDVSANVPAPYFPWFFPLAADSTQSRIIHQEISQQKSMTIHWRICVEFSKRASSLKNMRRLYSTHTSKMCESRQITLPSNSPYGIRQAKKNTTVFVHSVIQIQM